MQNIEIRKEPAQPTLVDIRDVAVDKKLPREERVAEFVRQIKNPYHFKCGKFTVRAARLRTVSKVLFADFQNSRK